VVEAKEPLDAHNYETLHFSTVDRVAETVATRNAMSTLTFPLANYPTGTTVFGPIALTQGLNGCVIRVARCTTATPTIWPNDTQSFALSLDVSYDGGATYQVNQFAFKAVGGIAVAKGVEQAEIVVRFNVSPQVPTHIKGSVTIEGGPLRTSLTITTL
jgi:hypothetical protein